MTTELIDYENDCDVIKSDTIFEVRWQIYNFLSVFYKDNEKSVSVYLNVFHIKIKLL